MTSRMRRTSCSSRSSLRLSRETPALSSSVPAERRPIPKMYVSAISMRLLRGRSTPAMRAIDVSYLGLLALALLVARVGADDADDALAPDHLALGTNFLHRRSDLHDVPRLNSPRQR